METTTDFRTVKQLVELRKYDMAKPNPEYQRGVVWTQDQQKRLIDSVMRGYQLPIIYLHDIKREIAGRVQESYDIIDGQQRIAALHLFVEGAFSLYQPDDERARFPKFLRQQPSCIPSLCSYQITPKTSLNTRCSASMLPNFSINGRIRSSGQLGRW